MEDQGNPWPRLLKYPNNRGVFCHVTHDEMAFSEVFPASDGPVCFLQSETVVQME